MPTQLGKTKDKRSSFTRKKLCFLWVCALSLSTMFPKFSSHLAEPAAGRRCAARPAVCCLHVGPLASTTWQTQGAGFCLLTPMGALVPNLSLARLKGRHRNLTSHLFETSPSWSVLAEIDHWFAPLLWELIARQTT